MAMSQRLDWSGKEQDKDICGKPLDLESIIQDHLRAGFEETQGQILPILQPLTQSREGHYEDESSSLLYVKSVIRTKADIFMDHAASFICHELRNILYPGPLISIDSYYPSSGYDFVNKAKLPEIQRRMSCILQYQHFQHTLSRIREEKRCGTHEARPGRGDKTRAYDQILQNIHPDWDQQDAAAWSKCRRTYREDTARGARWLRVADKLSFGFIILCGRRIAGQINGGRWTKDAFELGLTYILTNYPDAVEISKLLDPIAKKMLHQEGEDSTVLLYNIANRVEQYMGCI